MNKTLLVVCLLCALPIFAQTYHQTQPHACQIGTYNCNGLPLAGIVGAYSFGGSNTGITVGGYFSILTPANPNGLGGRITRVFTQAPPLHNGQAGQFGFGFQLSNGQLGVAKGRIQVFQTCHRYCYPYAVVEYSTVLIDYSFKR